MANKAFMKYITNLLLVCSLAFTACSSSMDDFLEEVSEPKRVQMYYADTLTVAHWNIGHFSLGRASDTTIGAEDSETMASVYRALIDSIDADVFGVCEYNTTFSENGEKTSSYIFGNYANSIIGSKLSYNCNAIFSRTPLTDSRVVFFERCVQHRYYIVSKLPINGHEVIFVETHLDWNQGADGRDCRISQIQTLINAFNDYPYVIICADYNVSDVNEFQTFVDAGFTLANGNEKDIIYTYPASKPIKGIDNIILKGFELLRIDVITNEQLSDHCLIKCRVKSKIY